MTGRILVTGAAGGIGTVLRNGLRGRYSTLRLLDVEHLGPARDGEEHVTADLRDYPSVEAAMDGMDAIVHLGAIPAEAPFADICEHNVVGTYHVFEAARRRGVERVVFASSNHATGFYPISERIGPDAPVRPDSYYGVSKVFGEALGRLYADKFSLQVACLRIGSFRARPGSWRELSTWLSHRDAVHLVRCCLEAPAYGFAVVYGVSANTRGWWHNPDGERLGYHPVDDAEAFAAELAEPSPAHVEPTDALQGGPFTAVEATAAQPHGVPPDEGS